MKYKVDAPEEMQLGLLMQDTLESYFEFEDSINPSESQRQHIKSKLEKLIAMLKKTDNKYLSEIECLRQELDWIKPYKAHLVIKSIL